MRKPEIDWCSVVKVVLDEILELVSRKKDHISIFSKRKFAKNAFST
jgi:hypothetical protein